jgi:hypothetical protein
MTIGAGLILIAVGAILRFAVATVSTHGFGVHTIGDILMIVGAVGVVLWLLVWGPWARNRRKAYQEPEPPPDAPPPSRYAADEPYAGRRYGDRRY